MRGRLIVLEGIDGSGKTSQINHLSEWLPKSGLMPPGTNLRFTREPGGTELGLALRQLLLNPPGGHAPEPLTELLLYAADRSQHVSQVILPALQLGDWIISDRFSGSTVTYQGYGRNLDLEIIKSLEQIATQSLIPDITILMNLPVEESFARRKSRKADRIEAEGMDFLSRVASGFEDLAQERHWIQIDARLSFEIVSSKIEEVLKEAFS